MSAVKNSSIIIRTNSVQKILNRLNSIDDPVLRYSMFLEAIHIFIDIVLISLGDTLNCTIEEKEDGVVEEKSKPEPNVKTIKGLEKDIQNARTAVSGMDEITKLFNKYFDGFGEWIRQPIYSPDHPYGNTIMKNAQKEFYGKEES